MGTKSIHLEHHYIMEASHGAKIACLQSFGIEVLGVAAVEYYQHDCDLPDELSYQKVVFNLYQAHGEQGQPLVGQHSVFSFVEDINSVSMWLRLPSGTVVESGFLPVESWFTSYGRFYRELSDHVRRYPARHLSEVALPF